ncbi:MAG TPA: dihydrofolate reductase family protein [Pseudonocardiaceae bacterium]|nr:dihydrofolate reductase family protein [Pseudonocardiaceae bacterium]
MRRIINSTYISLDGVIQDPQDWPGNGIESDGRGGTIQTDLLAACDAVLMGRHTYEAFAPVWKQRSGDPYSDQINSMAKYVVASQPLKTPWDNTIVLGADTDPIEEIRALKSVPGKDIVQYGFGQLSYALLEAGLLDELRLWVHPLFVGTATTTDLLFRPSATAQLTLVDTVPLNTGTVVLSYHANG